MSPTKEPRHLVLLTAVPLLALLVVWYPPSRLAMDAEVDRLCAIDGGATVVEQVLLSPDEYAKYIRGTSLKETARPEDLFYFESKYAVLKGSEDGLLLRKVTFSLVRRADEKILGTYTSYHRRGGDFFAFVHPSVYTCPSWARRDDFKRQGGIEAQVFIKGERHAFR
jgi:hypothetical protein